MNKNPVVHFEMPAKDSKRVSEFYKTAFGWDMSQMGAEYGEYITATTTDIDETTGRPKNAGAINGGFYKLDDTKPDMYPSIVISVDDVKAHVQIVKEAGGEILGEIMDIPGVGQYASFRDTEGNRVGMLQPAPMQN